MPETVYLIGSPGPAAPLISLREQLLAQQGADLRIESVAAPQQSIPALLRELLARPEFLGAEIFTPYCLEATRACDSASNLAQHSAAVTAVVRRGSGEYRLAGRNLLAKAFSATLLAAGVSNVRTALILGTGAAARSTMAALHEMGCNRFLVGFRTQKRATEIAHQYRYWKRQLHFFPLQEMLDFFGWSATSNCFASDEISNQATQHEVKVRAEREDRQDPRRWELVVNATPVGDPGVEPGNLLAEPHFFGCIGRVLDFAGGENPTELLQSAAAAGLPTIAARSISDQLANESVKLWLSELKLRSGELEPEEDPQAMQQSTPRRYLLKRR